MNMRPALYGVFILPSAFFWAMAIYVAVRSAAAGVAATGTILRRATVAERGNVHPCLRGDGLKLGN
jgi:hypothetical protein